MNHILSLGVLIIFTLFMLISRAPAEQGAETVQAPNEQQQNFEWEVLASNLEGTLKKTENLQKYQVIPADWK